MAEQTYWAVIELMGHVRMAGKVSEIERFGCKVGRIDIPDGDNSFKTQFFGGGSLYRETPCTEEVARAIAARCMPEPISPWEMPQRPALPAPVQDADPADVSCPDCGQPDGSCRCESMTAGEDAEF